ncbi:MAG: LuxR family transcriptional regulator [Acidimicrobiales bacterium]
MTLPLWVTDRAAPPTQELDRLTADGWRCVEGFDLPPQPWDLTDRRWVRTGSVDDDDTVAAAVLIAARGVGLVIGCPDDGRRARLLDDLRRIGTVELVALGPDPLAVLDDDQRALLAALATGASVGTAADALHLSTRTAERRLAAARRSLGVRTTAEAVALSMP